MGKTASRQRLRWILRAIALVFLVALGTRAWFPRHKSVGIPIRLPSASCSAEVLERPLIFRVLPNGELALGADIMPKQEAMARLPGIRVATYKRTLLFYADSSLSFEEVAESLSDVRAQLPRWDILVVTPGTSQPCEHWLNAHSGPAELRGEAR
jgi:biopolymer transport protein ExbD